MDVGTVLSAAQTLFSAVQSTDLNEMLRYKSDLKKLQRTLLTIKAVLMDADNKQVLSNEEEHYIAELKDAVFDADDLLDEFVTLSEQKRLGKETGFLVSRFNRLVFGFNMSRGVKKVRNKLDLIVSNHRKFGFRNEIIDRTVVGGRKREETCSHVYAGDIIGREDDVENVVRVLLAADVEQDVSFLTVVGVGGLGKTALAQLVFNDERISSYFSVKLWTCVSDHDQEQLNFSRVLGNILESVTGKTENESSSLDHIQRKLRDRLAGKRFLLLLDDVWNENRDEWVKLAGFLTGGQRGSWVLVTTRSLETGRVIGNGVTYELQGLSKENSWRLFERMAFERGIKPSHEYVQIGKEIVKGCANVPLAVRVVGSLLYGQRKSKWVSFQKAGLTNETNGILPILKLSYCHLKPPLRNCFSYCSLFPKDFEIDKEMLISLWIAQGYITPSKTSRQSIDDLAEEYFSTLLRRCFFQDVKKDEYGEIVSCKVHDLMHDIAQEVSANENYHVNLDTVEVSKAARHFAVSGHEYIEKTSSKTHIRTYLQVSKVGGMLLIRNLLENCPSLRTLDLRGADFEVLPNSIGKLLHLRYLDLSYNEKLKVLPKSITKLHNLQTLNLLGCRGLNVLPEDLSRLVKLRVLDVKDCCLPLLIMPPNFGRLTCLQKLDRFTIGDVNPHGGKRFDQLEDLKCLVNLRGSLGIQIRASLSAPYYSTGGAYMSTLERLSGIEILYLHIESYVKVDYEEALLEDLQPHRNLKYFRLVEYNGKKLPTWARKRNFASFLPNLVRIELKECLGLDRLPWLGLLPCLKFIRLEILPNLAYLSDDESSLDRFPCLEHLYLENLPKLKGWWPGKYDAPQLPQLKGLLIYECPEMTTIPLCPIVDDLRIYDANRSFELKKLDMDFHTRVTTGNVELLSSVPTENFQRLTEMRIESDYTLTSLSEIEDLFAGNLLSSLKVLEIWRCPKLWSLFGGLDRLTTLEKLYLRKTPQLDLEDDNGGVPWHFVGRTLRSLKLEDLPQLVNLPNGMQHLTRLESLSIVECNELRSIPKWITELSSIGKVEFTGKE